MPWEVTGPVKERLRLIQAFLTGRYAVSELAEDFGVSRKTAHKWLQRFAEYGPAGLADRPHAAHSQPNATPQAVVTAIIREKHAHPTWGPLKLLPTTADPPEVKAAWPAPSTRGVILARAGLTRHRRRRRRVPPSSWPFSASDRPNAVWWIKLGIQPERIEPGHPEQNGRHERMHLTLKQECCCPPAATVAAQQLRFDAFGSTFNLQRPHQALGLQPPAAFYRPSPRPYPARVEDPLYAADAAIRRVRSNGEIRWRGKLVFLSEALIGEAVAISETLVGYEVHFGPITLDSLDAKGERMIRPGERTLNRGSVTHPPG